MFGGSTSHLDGGAFGLVPSGWIDRVTHEVVKNPHYRPRALPPAPTSAVLSPLTPAPASAGLSPPAARASAADSERRLHEQVSGLPNRDPRARLAPGRVTNVAEARKKLLDQVSGRRP
jgi:hypothetical protein